MTCDLSFGGTTWKHGGPGDPGDPEQVPRWTDILAEREGAVRLPAVL